MYNPVNVLFMDNQIKTVDLDYSTKIHGKTDVSMMTSGVANDGIVRHVQNLSPLRDVKQKYTN